MKNSAKLSMTLATKRHTLLLHPETEISTNAKDAFDAIREEFKAQYTEEELEEKAPLIDRYYHDVEKEAMRRCILDEGKRLDGRQTTEIRPIWCEVGYLPGPHGSAIFTRGETQSLSSVTLGTKLDEKNGRRCIGSA